MSPLKDVKLSTGEEPTPLRLGVPLRDVKLCLDLECNATWSDDILICPTCAGTEVVLIESYINRKEDKPS